MKITVLGSSAAFSGKNEGCSSYLLSRCEKHYLIDTGPGCVSMLQNYISYKNISGILLSHLHADHVSDIYTLRYAVFTAQSNGYMTPPLPIYMAKSPKKTFKFIRDTIKEEFSITEISEDLQLSLDGLQISFKKVEHPVPTHAMRFEGEEGVFAYTADTGYSDELVSFCRGADILLAEATLQSKDKQLESLGHMTSETAGKFASRAEAKKLVLTHFWPENDRELSLREAQKAFHGDIETAEGGKEFSI